LRSAKKGTANDQWGNSFSKAVNEASDKSRDRVWRNCVIAEWATSWFETKKIQRMTIKDVLPCDQLLSDLLRNSVHTVGEAYLELKASGKVTSSVEFITLMLFHLGMAIGQAVPESAYPALEFVRLLPLEEQRRILIHDEDPAFVVTGKWSPVGRVGFRELNQPSCQALFGECEMLHSTRRLAAKLDHPDRFEVRQIKLSNLWKH